MKNIGERICRYREKCGLSQLELAELLDVSRQSVSKWETASAVPELAKLIKMSEIFGMSLDALVLGREADGEQTPEKAGVAYVKELMQSSRTAERSVSKIVVGACFLGVGIVLSVFFMLWSPLFGLFLLIPFMLSAFFCLKRFKSAALWCLETWFFAAVMYLNYGSGTRPTLIFDPRLYSPHTNELLIVFSWVEFLLLCAFVFMTVFAFRRRRFEISRGGHIAIAVTGGATLVLWLFFDKLFSVFCLYILCGGDEHQYLHWISQMDNFGGAIECAVEIILVAAFTACLIPTVYWLRDAIRRKAGKMGAVR